MAGVEQLLHRVRGSVRDLSAYDSSRPQCRIRLDGNESPFPLSVGERGEILKNLSSVPLNRYPDPDCSRLREAVSQWSGVCPDGIVFGNGSDELIQMAVEAFCGGSQTVLVPSPTFSMYALTAAALGRKVVSENLDPEFDLEEAAMQHAIEKCDPDIVFLASPNSPTGNLLSPRRVESVIKNAPGVVVVDEAYGAFCGADNTPLMEKYENLAVMRTFSKIGFAALRLGVLFMRPELSAQLSKVRLPYNINSLTQAAVMFFFENRAMFEENVKTVAAERAKIFKSLSAVEGVTVYRSDSNFLLIRFPDVAAADRVYRALVEKSVLVRNFSGGGVEDCLRVTVGLAEENREFEACLRDIVPAVL